MTNSIGPMGPKPYFDPSQSTNQNDRTDNDGKPQELASQLQSNYNGFMQQALNEIKAASEVDFDKVAAVKAKLARGEIGILQPGEAKSLSAARIAEGILEVDQFLPGDDE